MLDIPGRTGEHDFTWRPPAHKWLSRERDGCGHRSGAVNSTVPSQIFFTLGAASEAFPRVCAAKEKSP